MTEGPFRSAFDGDTEGVIRREIITYRMRKASFGQRRSIS